MTQGQTILVTGCAGFIGAKVSEFLLRDGYVVIGLDNLNHTYDVRLKQWRLARLQQERQFSFHTVNIADREELQSLLKSELQKRGIKLAAVINLAARAGVRQSVVNPWAYFETNVTGTLNLLELCRESGVNKFVLSSTSSLYGANNPRPFREDAATDCPLSPYAASKKAAEALSYTYHYLYGTDITVLRYFTVYGPAGRPDMSLFRFVQWLNEGRAVVVYGEGSQERDFSYVDDIAEGTVAALKPVGFEIINLGSDRPVVLMDAIHLIERLVQREAKIQREPAHPADVAATWADITKARSILGWEPRISIEEGIARSVRWYRENREWVRAIRTE
ncbi:MAG: SDR family NAD(P)-dependent oxidoreductase [Deltaproteobacteria bacterium]|nr:SDR family NAD(P)-dependent oxidoreductase [Deltaproteobacteria bacterium]